MVFITCIVCGKKAEFHGRGTYQYKFCSIECETVYYTNVCEFCGNTFVASNKGKKTCSKICENLLRSKSLTGRVFTASQKLKLSIRQKERIANGYNNASHFTNYLKEHGSWNKGLTKETDERVKKVAESIKETMNDPLWLDSVGVQKSEKLLGHTSHPSWNKGLTKEDTPQLKEIGRNISKAYYNKTPEERHAIWGSCRKTNTKPELLFKEILQSLNIEYKHNYPLFNIEHSYPADFYLKKYNMIIEIDGTYWHNYPYGLEKDHIRTQEIFDAGMNVLRIWEFEVPIIKQNLFILKAILDFVEV